MRFIALPLRLVPLVVSFRSNVCAILGISQYVLRIRPRALAYFFPPLLPFISHSFVSFSFFSPSISRFFFSVSRLFSSPLSLSSFFLLSTWLVRLPLILFLTIASFILVMPYLALVSTYLLSYPDLNSCSLSSLLFPSSRRNLPKRRSFSTLCFLSDTILSRPSHFLTAEEFAASR